MSSDSEYSFGIRTRWFSESGSEYPDPQRTDLYIHDVVDNFYRGIFSGSQWVWDDSVPATAEFDELMNERMKLAMEFPDSPIPSGPVVYEDYDEEIEEDVRRMKAEKEQDEPLADWEKDLLEAEKFYNEQAAKEGPDELEVNARGGKQSKLRTRFDLIPQAAQYQVAKVLSEANDKYGERNWRLIDDRSHLNHALAHLNAFLFHRADARAGHTPEDRSYLVEELSHAATRVLMALEIYLSGEDE